MYLDTLDPTGSFSSTNIFGDDGILSANTTTSSTTFSFLTTNDVYSAIYNDVVPIINSTGMSNYYYANFSRSTPPHANIYFDQTANTTVNSTGTLKYANTSQPVSAGATDNLQYINVGSIVQFTDNSFATVTGTTSNVNVTFGRVVANASVVSKIIPSFKNDISNTLVKTIAGQITAQNNFGLTYDQANQVWVNIPPGSTALSDPAAWLIKFTYNSGLYNIQYKTLEYVFGSAKQTKFYYDPTIKVYDSTIGQAVSDTIKVLKINSQATNSDPLGTDITCQIYNVLTEADGYVNQNQVYVTSPSQQLDRVPDNPDFFTKIVGDGSSRSDLYFQYKHNSPSRNRIDPTPVNIVDLYILTADYATNYINWLRDLTGTLKQPIAPTTSSLEIAYDGLDNYKAVSDSLIYNSAKFKPLFGAKADPSLQARFQVVKNPAVSITDNEIKTRVIAAVNAYFNLANWDFGDTFYFSELAAYLHTVLVPNIASVLIVPADDTLVFGNFFQINAEPWEIITSAATVDNVDIISAVTAAHLNLGNTLIGTP